MGIMFIDRFIKLPIKVYDTEQKELTGKCDYFDNVIYVLPLEISSFKPTIDEDNEDADCVSVQIKNGDKFYVYMTLEEFIEALNKHQK